MSSRLSNVMNKLAERVQQQFTAPEGDKVLLYVEGAWLMATEENMINYPKSLRFEGRAARIRWSSLLVWPLFPVVCAADPPVPLRPPQLDSPELQHTHG